MGSIAARYDRSAARYEQWWAPVLAPSARGLLPVVEARLSRPPARVLDLGAGTGTLSRAVLGRWPGTRVVGLDASGAMLGVARGETEARLPTAADRVEWRTGSAEAIPFADGAFDVVLSSFVLQLVGDRSRVLREIRRVLAPGGWLGYVTWLADDTVFEPQQVVDDLIDEERLDDTVEDEEPRAGDPASPDAAALQARRAGFRGVQARRTWLEHAWTARSYRGFVEHYDAAELFGSLDPATRRATLSRLGDRLDRLPPSAFRWRAPIVMLTGRRPVEDRSRP